MQRLFLGLLALFLAPLMLSACSAVTGPDGSSPNEVNQPGMYIVPVRIGSQAFVGPETMVDALLKSGFNAQQIAAKGPEIMQALIEHGGARVLIDGNISHAIAVFGDKIYVSGITSGVVVVDNA